MKRRKKGEKKIQPVHPAAGIILSLGFFGMLIHLFSVLFPSFADFIGSTVGAALRFVLAKLFNIFPFSFMEFLLYASPLIIAVTAYFAVKCARGGRIYIVRAISAVLSVAAGVYFCFSVGFAPGYRGSPLSEKMGLERRDVSPEELYTVTLTVIEEVNSICENVEYNPDGSSYMPFSLNELSDKLCVSYKELSGDLTFIKTFSSDVKPIVISRLMTYTHISGIYSFFTGEANLNTNYPDYVNVYTAAHEMAHQRGISREDEANFVAFLVCKDSDDSYIRYSAYLNMYEYLSNALYSADYELWEDAYFRLSSAARGELDAYSDFFDEYRQSTVSDVSDTLNNAYLESQGTAGTKSYGMVVDLAVAYYLH